MNTGRDALPDGHREAQGPDELYYAELRRITAERDEWKEKAQGRVLKYVAVTAERDAARASCAALVEALILTVGEFAEERECTVCDAVWYAQGEAVHEDDCALATLAAAGAALLERLAALERYVAAADLALLGRPGAPDAQEFWDARDVLVGMGVLEVPS